MSNQYPVHQEIETERGYTLFKNNGWWKAVLAYNNHGQQKIAVYLWKKVDSEWKRKQKYAIRSRQDWKTEREVISELTTQFLDE
jgi:hypothetical protein